ncbi:DUF2635 domain-containing protein [Rhodoferax sp.]|uniref:DUF2635 domain-containing protein n=1 Tax=Rhodoferax sp. TaxID=50421 RepID=UPI002ACE10F8|nr:DUF2635 domain-containing protein [Rhodoferax sp.]MDZ7920757.1 DUF2635 domain-containing protein [Rhodoferax sp.]
MTERIFIKPTSQPEGQPPLKVRKPVNGHLAEQGESVNLDSYWQRRLNDGDVVEAEEPAEVPAEAPGEGAAPVKPRSGKSA